jgi:hypothetical protein
MQTSLPATKLLLAFMLIWLAWPVVPAEAQTPCGCPMADNCADAGQGMGMGPGQWAGQCAPPPGMCDVPRPAGQCSPRWTFAGEAIALQRTTTPSQPLFLNASQDQPINPLNSENMDFSLAAGYQVSAIRHNVFGCGCDVEAAYFQVDGFNTQADVPGASFMVTDFNHTGFTVVDGTARYTSALYSGEVNLRRECCDWLTVLAGFRMGQLNEHYRGSGEDFFARQTTDSLATDTYNHFYGFQLGAEAEAYNMGGPLRISAFCKGGVFDNISHQDYLRVHSDVADESFASGADQAAFLGETGVVLKYAVTKCLSVRVSGEALWLTGVALAPEQISAVNLRTRRDTADTSGTVFYYGGGLGLEYVF